MIKYRRWLDSNHKYLTLSIYKMHALKHINLTRGTCKCMLYINRRDAYKLGWKEVNYIVDYYKHLNQ